MSCLECENLNIHAGTKMITENISFTLGENETLAVIGRTGSGKTMTALSIMGLLPNGVSMDGRILFGDKEASLKERRKLLGDKISYIPQNGHEFLCPALRVKTQLKDTLKHLGIKEDISKDLLLKAGFDNPGEILSLYPFELSGGMAQRVTIAMALASDPFLLICDEATNGLSQDDSLGFIENLKTLFPSAGRIVITHDIKTAALCDSILVMHDGKMVLKGTRDEVLTSHHPYVEALLDAMPERGMKINKIYGEESV